MNNQVRKIIQDIIDSLNVETDALQNILDEEDLRRENMFENTEMYEISEQASEDMGEALDSLENAISSLENII